MKNNRNIGRDQINPQKTGGKADPVVKRRLSQGSIPRLLCGQPNALPTELDKDSWMSECPRHQISIRDLDFKAPLNFSMPIQTLPSQATT